MVLSEKLDNLATAHFDLGRLDETPPSDGLVKLCKDIPFQDQADTNRCGPFSVSISLSYWLPDIYGPGKLDGHSIADDMKYRLKSEKIPIVGGCTLVFGITEYMKLHGFNSKAHKGARLDDLRRHIHAGIPSIVVLCRDGRKTDSHYRTVVGYDDTKEEIYFNDSNWHGAVSSPQLPGNRFKSYDDFEKEWMLGALGITKRFGIYGHWFLPVYPTGSRSAR